MVRIDRKFDRDMEYYDLPVEDRYVDYLRETDRAIVIGNLIVDIPALVERKFVCHTDLCVGKEPLDDMDGRSCCTSFEVRAAPKELKQIKKLVAAVKERYPTIATAIDEEHDGQWWYYSEEDFNKVLERKADGSCVFLTPREDGFYKCGLHAGALDEGVDPNRHKPTACVLYPLFLVEVDDDILLTCTSEETRHVIGDDGEYHHFDCLCPNKMATKPLYREMKEVITLLFGKKAYKAIDDEAKRLELVEED